MSIKNANKFNEVIDSIVNGNIMLNQRRVKFWNNKDKKELLEIADSEYGKEIKDVIIQSVILS